jgi:hypothetical protein
MDDSGVFTEIIKNLKFILPLLAISGNEEHFYAFIFKIDNLDLTLTTWRLAIEFLQCIRNNEYLFLNKDFNEKLIHLSMKHILTENFQIASEVIKVIVVCLKYSRKHEKENIMNHISKEIYSNGSFYKRRLAVVFFAECCEQLSVNYLVENRLFETTIKLFTDSPCITHGLLPIIQQIYHLLEQREKKQLACKLDLLRDTKDKDIIYVSPF